jgi:MYXO-CTERM domain-containing protein
MKHLLNLTAAMTLLALPGAAWADGDDAHSTTYEALLPGGGVVSEGAGVAQRISGTGIGEIEITGIPAGAEVVEVFVHWVMHGGFGPTVTLSSTFPAASADLSGTLIGTAPDTCWGIGDNHAYRADGSSVVTGNGTYTVDGFNYIDGVQDATGVSITVVYQDLSSADVTQVVLNDGAIFRESAVEPADSVANWSTPVGGPISRVRAHFAVSDGQQSSDGPTVVNGVEIAQDNWEGDGCLSPGCTDPIVGGDGAFWDDDTFDLTVYELVSEGSTQSIASIADPPGTDCLVWVAYTLEVTYPDPCMDDDDDGFTDCEGDCDDDDDDVFPGAQEVCNDVDDNCDGVIDDGVATLDWYPDLDGDGYGDEGVTPDTTCIVVADSVNNGDDCDDEDEDVNPDGVEVCEDGLDNDCNGDVDLNDEECATGCSCSTGAPGSGGLVALLLGAIALRRRRRG